MHLHCTQTSHSKIRFIKVKLLPKCNLESLFECTRVKRSAIHGWKENEGPYSIFTEQLKKKKMTTFYRLFFFFFFNLKWSAVSCRCGTITSVCIPVYFNIVSMSCIPTAKQCTTNTSMWYHHDIFCCIFMYSSVELEHGVSLQWPDLNLTRTIFNPNLSPNMNLR